MAMQIIEQETRHIDELEGEAWAVCNAGYAFSNREVYLDLGQQLYRQAMQARIQALFERGDAQNARLDTLVREQRPRHTSTPVQGRARTRRAHAGQVSLRQART